MVFLSWSSRQGTDNLSPKWIGGDTGRGRGSGGRLGCCCNGGWWWKDKWRPLKVKPGGPVSITSLSLSRSRGDVATDAAAEAEAVAAKSLASASRHSM